MKAALAVLFVTFASSYATAAVVTLPTDFSGTQGTLGIHYESIGDSRSSNTMHPGAGVVPMNFLGDFSFGYPGDLPHPTYANAVLFPYVQHRPDFGGLTIQPGTGGFDFGTGTSNIGIAVRFDAPADGVYRLAGDFAPNNASWVAGNGVDVLIAKGLDLDNPVFAATISDAHAVNLLDPFGGTGVTPFDVLVNLLAGDSVRFVVFADGQGQDGTFDTSAFRVEISQVPEPSTRLLLLSAIFAFALSKRVKFCERSR